MKLTNCWYGTPFEDSGTACRGKIAMTMKKGINYLVEITYRWHS
jgi:hypothetical protein